MDTVRLCKAICVQFLYYLGNTVTTVVMGENRNFAIKSTRNGKKAARSTETSVSANLTIARDRVSQACLTWRKKFWKTTLF